MVLTEEFKQDIIDKINNDAAFEFDLYQALLKSVKDDLVTKTYLDEALAKQAQAFHQELYEVKHYVDKKSDAQTQAVDEKLDAQTQAFDEKLDAQTISLKNYIDAKLGRIGSRWGEDAENAIREFFTKMAAQWGGTVEKWRKKVRFKNEKGYVYEKQYKIDMVVRNGKITLVEVKAHCDVEDIERFLENINFYEQTEGQGKTLEKVLLTFSVDERVTGIVDNAGIEIIDGSG